MTEAKSDETINRALHEKVMNKCWHEPVVSRVVQKVCKIWKCSKCGLDDIQAGMSNGVLKAYQGADSQYCSDLNLMAEVEKAVVEKFGAFEYGEIFLDIVCSEGGMHYNPNLDNSHAARLALATARQRATACVAVIEGNNGK